MLFFIPSIMTNIAEAWTFVDGKLSGHRRYDGTEWVPGLFRANLLPGEAPLAAFGEFPCPIILTTAGRLVCHDNTILGEARAFSTEHVKLLQELAAHMLAAEKCSEDFDLRVCEQLLAKTIAALR
jgi:hypothetical protein